MIRERIVAVLVAVFALGCLVAAIPAQTVVIEGARMQPGLFPSIAALIMLASALLHTLCPRGSIDGGSPIGVIARNLLVLVGFAVATVAGMSYLGYYVAGPLALAFGMWFMGERRPFWLAVGIGGSAALIWLVFEVLLERPLP